LAMTDTTRRYLESTAVSSRFVREMMQNCPARRQILLLDCCFSGAFPRGWTFRADEAIGSGHYFEAKGSGQAILTASDDMQYAFEGDEVTMQKVAPSMFTEIVVRGITNGEADIDLDGNITIDDLHGYVLEQLRTRNSRQNPQKWYFGLTEDIVLAANPNPHVRALVEELRSRIESEDVRLRLAAVHDLGNLARRSDGRRRLAAIKALEALTKDDSKAVSAAARATLGDLLEQAQEEVGQNKGQTSGENDNMEEQPPAGAATSARQASKRKPDETIAQDPRLRFAVRFSFVPFVLVLLSYLLPFYHELGNPLQFGHEYLWDLVVYFSNPRPVEGRILFNEIALFLAFLCPIFVLCSHFLKYRWKAVLEVVVSWICFVLLATWILNPLENVPYGRMGAFLACTFAAAGAVVKTFLLIHWRKLTKI